VEGTLAMLGVWRSPARLMVTRRGRPLHFGQAKEGWYFASGPEGLPGNPRGILDNTTRVLSFEGGELVLDGGVVGLDEKAHELL
jgi:hypothetical protein